MQNTGTLFAVSVIRPEGERPMPGEDAVRARCWSAMGAAFIGMLVWGRCIQPVVGFGLCALGGNRTWIGTQPQAPMVPELFVR